jgi:hypothetical protein
VDFQSGAMPTQTFLDTDFRHLWYDKRFVFILLLFFDGKQAEFYHSVSFVSGAVIVCVDSPASHSLSLRKFDTIFLV